MLGSVVSIFEATGDINTALDECLLDATEHFRGDISVLQQHLSTFIENERNETPPSSELISSSLELIQHFYSIGNEARQLELHAQERISVWAPRNSAIQTKEQELEDLQQLSRAIETFHRAKQLQSVFSSPTKPIEARVDALLQFLSLPVLPRTQFSLWTKHQVETFQTVLKTELHDVCQGVVKKITPEMYRAHNKLPTCSQLLSLCIRLQLNTVQEGDVVHNEFVSTLWGMTLFAKPVLIRFQFHFFTEAATNRIDRPEWFVAFVLENIRDRAMFVERELQPLCSHEKVLVDLLSQFIRILVRAIHARLESSWHAELALDDALMCHTMDQLLRGDRVLLKELGYASGVNWPTLASFFCADNKVDKWLSADVAFAKARIHTELANKKMWDSKKQLLFPNEVMVHEDIDFYAGECVDIVLHLVDNLGDRLELLQDPVRSRYGKEVLLVVLQDFVSLAKLQSEFSVRVNALVSFKERLYDWRLKTKYMGFQAYSRLFDEQNANNDDAWIFSPCVVAVERLLEEEITNETNRVYQSSVGLLERGGEWERRKWLEAEGAKSDLDFVLSALKDDVAKWSHTLNPISKAKLFSSLSVLVETYFVTFLKKRTFSDVGLEQFRVDFLHFAHLFESKSAQGFPKVHLLVKILSLNDADGWKRIEQGDEEYFFEEVLVEEADRVQFKALGISLSRIARMKTWNTI